MEEVRGTYRTNRTLPSAATGREIEFVSTAILRVADGQIAAAVDVVASAEPMAQLSAG